MGMSLPLNKVLPAIDKKDRKFWDRLTDEEKKAFAKKRFPVRLTQKTD